MIFLCEDCKNEFEIDDKECEGYYNWKCPNCSHIAPLKDLRYYGNFIFKCPMHTAEKRK